MMNKFPSLQEWRLSSKVAKGAVDEVVIPFRETLYNLSITVDTAKKTNNREVKVGAPMYKDVLPEEDSEEFCCVEAKAVDVQPQATTVVISLKGDSIRAWHVFKCANCLRPKFRLGSDFWNRFDSCGCGKSYALKFVKECKQEFAETQVLIEVEEGGIRCAVYVMRGCIFDRIYWRPLTLKEYQGGRIHRKVGSVDLEKRRKRILKSMHQKEEYLKTVSVDRVFSVPTVPTWLISSIKKNDQRISNLTLVENAVKDRFVLDNKYIVSNGRVLANGSPLPISVNGKCRYKYLQW